MTDNYDENTILKERIKLLEEQLTKQEKKTINLEEYARDLRLYGDTPTNQFSHQYKLLFHPNVPVSHASKRRDLFNPDILLGNIANSKTLYFFQRDYTLLQRFFDMGLRSEGVMDLFDNLFYGWEGTMKMTQALGGTERILQSFGEPMQPGFESFSFMGKRKAEKERKKKLGDYLSMMRRGGGGGGEGGGNIYE